MASGEDDAELESSEDEMGDELEHVVFIHHDLQESDVCAHCPCTQPQSAPLTEDESGVTRPRGCCFCGRPGHSV